VTCRYSDPALTWSNGFWRAAHERRLPVETPADGPPPAGVFVRTRMTCLISLSNGYATV
jgi:hypothetical protein